MWEILTGEEPYANMHCGAIIGKAILQPWHKFMSFLIALNALFDWQLA